MSPVRACAAAVLLLAAQCSGVALQVQPEVQPDPATLRRGPSASAAYPAEALQHPGEQSRAAPVSMQRGLVESSGAVLQDMSALAAADMAAASYAEALNMAAKSDTFFAKLKSQALECKKQVLKEAGPAVLARPAAGSTNPGIFFKPWNKGMNFLRESEAWGKKPGRHPPQPRGSPIHIAYLMFAKDRVLNEDIWLRWMEQGKVDGMDFSMYIHAYGLPPRGVSEWKSQRFNEYLVQEQARTVWCGIWDAQMLLLSKALMNTRHTHFVMLSSDSVPVKPMRWMHNRTREEPLSRFCADDYWRDPWPRAETWMMLRRGDALFYQENRAFAERHLRKDCEEEFAWYFPLRARWDNFAGDAPIMKECIMFSNWADGERACKEQWAANADACNCPTLRQSNSTLADFKSPVSYHDVGHAALEELVRSPFWFARKFSEGAVPQELTEVLEIGLTDPAPKKKKRFGIFR